MTYDTINLEVGGLSWEAWPNHMSSSKVENFPVAAHRRASGKKKKKEEQVERLKGQFSIAEMGGTSCSGTGSSL